jgi:hypothetical protein
MLLPKLENNAWSTLAIESVLIVLSVILGFLVTEWRQASENEQLARTARQTILDEVVGNYRRVQGALSYHRVLRDTLQALSDPSPQTVSRVAQAGVLDASGRSGIAAPADPLSTAWTSAQSTGAVRHMAWQDVNAFAQAYARQKLYARHNGWLGQSLFQTSLSEDGGLYDALRKPRLLPLIGQFIAQERQLLQRYRTTLAHFGRALPADTIEATLDPASQGAASEQDPLAPAREPERSAK